MRWLVSALGALTLWAAYPGLVSAQSNPGAVAPAAPAPVDFRDQSNFGVTFLDQDTFSVAQPFPTGDTSITLKWRATKQGSDGTVTADTAPAGSKLMVAVASPKTEVRYSGSTVTTVEVPDEVTLVTLPYSSTIPDGGLQSGTLTFRIPQTIRTNLSSGSNPLPVFLVIALVKSTDYDADRGINYLYGRAASALKITATGGVESDLDKKGFSGLEVVIPGDANPARSGKEASVGHRLLAPTVAGGPSYGLATSANPTRVRYYVEKLVTEGSITVIRRYLTFFGTMTDDLIAGYSATIPTAVGASALDLSKRVLMPYGDTQFALDTYGWTLSVLVTAGPGAGLLFKSAGNFAIKGYLNMTGSGSPLPSFNSEVRVGVQDGVVIPDTIAIPADNEAGFSIGFFYVKVSGLNPSSSDADTTKVRVIMSEVDSNNGRPSPYWLTLKSDINFSHAGITAGATLSSPGLFFNVPITIPTGPDGKNYFFCLHVYSGEGQDTPNSEVNYRPMSVGEDAWGTRRLYQGAYACKVVRVTGGSRTPAGLTPISGIKMALSTTDTIEIRAGGHAKAQWTLPEEETVGFDLTQSKVRVTLYIPSPPDNYWFSTAVVLSEGTSSIGSNDLTVTIPAWFTRPGFEDFGFTALRVTIIEGPGLGLEWNNINGSPSTRPAIKAASTTATPQITWSWPQAGSIITSDQSNSVSIVVSAIGDATKRSVLQDYTRALIYIVPATVAGPSIGCNNNVALHNSVMGFHIDGTSSFINADLWPSSQTISSLSSSCFSGTTLDSSSSTQSWKLALVIEPGNSNSNELTSRLVVYSEAFSFMQGNTNNNDGNNNGGNGNNNRGYDLHEPIMFYDSNSRGIVIDLDKPPAMPIPAGQTLNLPWNCTTAAFNQNEVPQPCTFPANSRIVPALAARQQRGWAQDSSGNRVPAYWPSETLIIKLSEGVVLSAVSGRGSIAYTIPSTVRTNRSSTESIPWFMTLVVIPPQNNGQPSDATESLYGITNYASFAVPALFKGGRVDDSATLDYPLITLLSILPQSVNPPATAEGGSSVRAGSDAVVTFKVAAPLNGKPTYSSASTRFRVIVMVPNPRGSNNEATISDKLFFQAQFQGYLGWDSFSSSRDLNNNGNAISLPAVGGVETTFYRSVSMPHRDASLAYDQPQATLSIVVVSGPGAGLQFNLGSAFQLKGFLNLQAPGAIGSSGEGNLVTLSFTTAFASSIVLSSSSSQNVVLGFTGLPASPSSKVAFFGAEISPATGLPYPAFALKPSETINTNQKTVTLPQTLPTSNSDTRNEADSRKYLLCAAITDNTDGSKSPQNEPYDEVSRRLYPGAYTCVVSSLFAGSLYTGFSAVTSLEISTVAGATQEIVAGGQVRVTWSLSSPVAGFDSTSKARIGVFDFQDLDPFTSSPKFVGIVAENIDVRSGTATGTLPAWLTRKNANYLMLAVAIQVYDGPGKGYSMTNFQLSGNNNGPSWLQLTPSTVETPQITVAQPSDSSVWRLGDSVAPVRWNIPAVSAATKRSVFAEETMVDLYLVKATASAGAAINNNEGMYLLQLPLGAKYDGSASNFIGNISIPNYSLTGLDASTSTKSWKLELRIYGSGRDDVTSPIYFQSAAFTLLASVNGGSNNNGGDPPVDSGDNTKISASASPSLTPSSSESASPSTSASASPSQSLIPKIELAAFQLSENVINTAHGAVAVIVTVKIRSGFTDPISAVTLLISGPPFLPTTQSMYSSGWDGTFLATLWVPAYSKPFVATFGVRVLDVASRETVFPADAMPPPLQLSNRLEQTDEGDAVPPELLALSVSSVERRGVFLLVAAADNRSGMSRVVVDLLDGSAAASGKAGFAADTGAAIVYVPFPRLPVPEPGNNGTLVTFRLSVALVDVAGNVADVTSEMLQDLGAAYQVAVLSKAAGVAATVVPSPPPSRRALWRPGTTLTLPFYISGVSTASLRQHANALTSALQEDLSRVLSFLRIGRQEVRIDLHNAYDDVNGDSGAGAVVLPVSFLFSHSAHGTPEAARAAARQAATHLRNLLASTSDLEVNLSGSSAARHVDNGIDGLLPRAVAVLLRCTTVANDGVVALVAVSIEGESGSQEVNKSW